MMRLVAIIAITIVVFCVVAAGAAGVLRSSRARDARELTVLEVEGAEGLVPEVLGRGCPIVVTAADGVWDAVERRAFPCKTGLCQREWGEGCDAVVAADFAVLHGAVVKVVHPAHRPDLTPADGGLVLGRGWRDESWGYVEVRLPPGGCLVLPRHWGVAGWKGEAFHVTSAVSLLGRGIRMLLGWQRY